MKTLEPLINQLVEMIKNGTDFVAGQIPDVAQQILRYEFARSLAMAVVSLVALIVLSIAICKHFRWHLREELAAEECCLGVGFVSTLFAIPSIAFLSASVDVLLKISIAPKLFLLDYLKGYLK